MRSILHQILNPVREAGRTVVHDSITALLAGFFALIGCTVLLAAACVALVPFIGVAGALAVTGVLFLILATGVLLVRWSMRRRYIVVPLPEPAIPPPDPLTRVVFDLSFSLGQMLRRRR